jgi:iron complex transport system ATP-binding protein
MLVGRNIVVLAGLGKRILSDATFESRPGEILAVIGPNGAGKSTLLKALVGLVKASEGEALWKGSPISKLGRRERALLMAYLPQNTQPIPSSVFDTVLLGRKPHAGFRPGKADLDAALKVMGFLGLNSLGDVCVTKLSGGEFKKVLIGRVMAQDTEVMLLDEPLGSLDIKNQLETMEEIKRITLEGEKTTFLVLHDLNLALRYAQKILLLSKGRTIFHGETPYLLSSHLSEAYDMPLSIASFEGKPFVIY